MIVNPDVSSSVTPAALICEGGTFTLPATSNNNIAGTWSPAIDNTKTTTYTFTPTNCECANTATMTVTENPKVTPTFTQVAAICEGGTFTLRATSNNNIAGTWSPAIDNTKTSTYTFTPTNGECANTATMTVTVNPKVTPTFTQAATISLSLHYALPISSNNNIAGTWSPAIDNTKTTTYTFTPTNGECANTATMTVTVNPKVTPTFTQVAAICEGGTIGRASSRNSNYAGTLSAAIE